MRKGIRAGNNKTNQTSASRKGFVCARWLVVALGIFIIVATSAHGQTPVFIPDFVFNVEAGQSGIKSVAGLKEGTHTRETPCVAKIGDIVSLEVGNLVGWLEKLKKDKVIDSEETETGEALVLKQVPNLNLFIDEHLMKTLKPTEYLRDDANWYSDPEQKKAAMGRSWLEFTLNPMPRTRQAGPIGIRC